MIAAIKVPGFDVVQDICGADDPIVLYNEHLFFYPEGESGCI